MPRELTAAARMQVFLAAELARHMAYLGGRKTVWQKKIVKHVHILETKRQKVI